MRGMRLGFDVRNIGALVALAAVMILPGSAQAQEAAPTSLHPEAVEAISRVKSPYCPGLMLEVCPTATADDLRDSINSMAENGLSADSLVELVIADIGEDYRALPKRSGTGLFAWVMPPVALVLGLGLVTAVLRRARGQEDTFIVEGAPITDESEARLQAALAELEDE